MRRAFTLIEILVSVMLIAIVVLGIAKIQERNLQTAQYISERTKEELANTLFLGSEAMRYTGDEKDAYTLLHAMGVKKSASRDLLKSLKRTIRVTDPLPIAKTPYPVELRAILLKGRHSSRYYRVRY